MKSHTPGRLEMFEDDESIGVAAGDNILARMTVYSTDDPDYPDDVQRANATLWAAAPKLLAACQAMRAYLEFADISNDQHESVRLMHDGLRDAGWDDATEDAFQFLVRTVDEALSAALPCPATGESADPSVRIGTE